MTGPAAGTPRQLEKVLIADDEASIRMLIHATIGGSDYAVVEAAEGEEAWRLIQQHRPTLVLLDANISGRSAHAILSAIRADSNLSATRVILLTTSADEPATKAAIGAGADSFIVEPFSPRELLARLDETLWLGVDDAAS